ncbi:hypothetical protein F5148DRAFT_1369892 [Russula earlei]|uniref:Uncharacterized protein n=1 Tax=Russula earlei TaxID=71964 RepID=A0ACC0U1C7_9AGAM|nr:hypothetical protein F5148DRAFT_1369892 [Russula earlei]
MRASAIICLAIGVAPSFSLPSGPNRVNPSTTADHQNLAGHESSNWFEERSGSRQNNYPAGHEWFKVRSASRQNNNPPPPDVDPQNDGHAGTPSSETGYQNRRKGWELMMMLQNKQPAGGGSPVKLDRDNNKTL